LGRLVGRAKVGKNLFTWFKRDEGTRFITLKDINPQAHYALLRGDHLGLRDALQDSGDGGGAAAASAPPPSLCACCRSRCAARKSSCRT